MNYSASDAYHQQCDQFRKKLITLDKIKTRWFRNYYVLYQSRGYFMHNTWAMHVNEIIKNQYTGKYYGPFISAEVAQCYAALIKRTHEDFILGG